MPFLHSHIFILESKHIKKQYVSGDWKEWSFLLYSTFAKDHFHHLYNIVGEERPKWLNILHLLRGPDNKVSNAVPPFKFKYSFFAPVIAFPSQYSPLLSGRLLGDFRWRWKRDETQLEVDTVPPKLKFLVVAACHYDCVGVGWCIFRIYLWLLLIVALGS